MFPHQLIWIAIRRIGRQEKQPQFSAQGFNERFRLLRAMRGPRSTIRKIVRLAPAIRRFKTSMKTAALTPPFSDLLNVKSKKRMEPIGLKRRVALHSIATWRSRKALPITLTEESDMAAAAITGDKRMPKAG